MEKFGKGVLILVVIAITMGMLSLWYETVLLGNYFASSGVFLTIMAGVAPLIVLVFAYYVVRFIVKFKLSDLDL